jgi:hypothetical protein
LIFFYYAISFFISSNLIELYRSKLLALLGSKLFIFYSIYLTLWSRSTRFPCFSAIIRSFSIFCRCIAQFFFLNCLS